MLTITLLGPFEVCDRTTERVLGVRTYSRLYALLALNLGKPIHRSRLLELLYLETEPSVATNRLRVVLSGLRKTLGPALQEHQQEIWLCPDRVQVDTAETTEIMDLLQNEVDPEAELCKLLSLLPTLSKPLLPGMDESWLTEFRDEWTERVQATLRRAQSLAALSNDAHAICEIAQVAFLHEPFDEEHWMQYLRAKSRLGDATGASRAFYLARRKLNDLHHSDFSPELLELAEDVRVGRARTNLEPSQPDSQTEREFLWMAIEWLVDRDIEPLQGLIKSKVFREVQTLSPRPALDFIERVLAKSTERSATWIWVKYAQARSYSGFNRAAETILIWEDVEHEPMEPDLRTGFLVLTSFAYFQIRDYDRAIAAVNECIEVQEQQGNVSSAQLLHVNKASFYWHLGHYDAAHEMYDIAEVPHVGKESKFDRISLASVFINRAFLETMRGDYGRAYGFLIRVRELLSGITADSIEPMLLPVQGFVWVVNGDPSGYLALIEGLKFGYRVKHERGQQIGLDYAAGVLAHAGCGRSVAALLAYAEQWREETQHQFSVAERELTQRFLAMGGDAPWAQPFPAAPTPRQVLNWVVVEVRTLHRQAMRAEMT